MSLNNGPESAMKSHIRGVFRTCQTSVMVFFVERLKGY